MVGKSAMLFNHFSFVPITSMNTVDLPPTRLLLIGLTYGTICSQSIINRAAMRTKRRNKEMLEFKKYSSIENSFNKEFMERIMAEMPTDLEYVVQEKVHGANTSFLCDGEVVRFAKRSSMLEAEEKFYDYPELLERYKGKVLALAKDVLNRYKDVRSVNVFGEMFGGTYLTKMCSPTANCLLSRRVYATLLSMSSMVLTSMSSTRMVVGFCKWMKQTNFSTSTDFSMPGLCLRALSVNVSNTQMLSRVRLLNGLVSLPSKTTSARVS